MQKEIILHHNQGSPYSEKIKIALWMSNLPWLSVKTSKWVPRSIQEKLVWWYSRRVLILQIWADIYCDSAEILNEIWRLTNNDKIILENNSKKIQEFVYFTEAKILTSMLIFLSKWELIFWYFKNLPFKEALEFIVDRAKLAKKFNKQEEKIDTKKSKKLLEKFFIELEEKLIKKDFLFSNKKPTVADFTAYHIVWYYVSLVWEKKLRKFNNLIKWKNKIDNFWYGKYTEINPIKSIEIAKKYTPKGINENMKQSSNIWKGINFVPNDALWSITPPVSGIIVWEDENKYIIERKNNEIWIVHIHFPKKAIWACW